MARKRKYVGLFIVFGRPFVKRFALCYQTVVCLSCLSVTFVHCGQMVGRIKMKLGMQVCLSPGHYVLDGAPAPPPPKGGGATQFSAHICCSQMAEWIKMPLGMEAGLIAGDCVRWGPCSTLPKMGAEPPPQFSAHFYCGQTAAIPPHASRCHLVWR